MRCEEIMRVDVEWVEGGSSVREAAARMRDRDIGFLPVVDSQGVVIGTVTDRDITVRVVADGGDVTVPVSRCMTREVIGCFKSDDVRTAEELMALYQKARIVVLDDRGLLAGVISLGDVARCRDEREAAETLRDVKSEDAPSRIH
jgi:CBS domain-containing protein